MVRQAFGKRGDGGPMTSLLEAIALVRGAQAMRTARSIAPAKPTHGTLVSIKHKADGRRRVRGVQRPMVPESEVWVFDMDALQAFPAAPSFPVREMSSPRVAVYKGAPYWWPGIA